MAQEKIVWTTEKEAIMLNEIFSILEINDNDVQEVISGFRRKIRKIFKLGRKKDYSDYVFHTEPVENTPYWYNNGKFVCGCGSCGEARIGLGKTFKRNK